MLSHFSASSGHTSDKNMHMEQPQKEYPNLLLGTEVCTLGWLQSHGAALLPEDAVLPCLSVWMWALQVIHQLASFLKWQGCSRTSLIDTAQP